MSGWVDGWVGGWAGGAVGGGWGLVKTDDAISRWGWCNVANYSFRLVTARSNLARGNYARGIVKKRLKAAETTREEEGECPGVTARERSCRAQTVSTRREGGREGSREGAGEEGREGCTIYTQHMGRAGLTLCTCASQPRAMADRSQALLTSQRPRT